MQQFDQSVNIGERLCSILDILCEKDIEYTTYRRPNVEITVRVVNTCVLVSKQCRNRRFPELYTLTNFIGKSPKTQTIGKTYNAPKITYTRKAHYATTPQFPDCALV